MNSVLGNPVSLCMGDLKFIDPTPARTTTPASVRGSTRNILMSSTILRDIVRRGQEVLVSQNGHHRERSAEVHRAEGTTTMLANLIVSGLCLLLLLRIVCKAWRRAFGIPSARDLDETRDLAARRPSN